MYELFTSVQVCTAFVVEGSISEKEIWTYDSSASDHALQFARSLSALATSQYFKINLNQCPSYPRGFVIYTDESLFCMVDGKFEWANFWNEFFAHSYSFVKK